MNIGRFVISTRRHSAQMFRILTVIELNASLPYTKIKSLSCLQQLLLYFAVFSQIRFLLLLLILLLLPLLLRVRQK